MKFRIGCLFVVAISLLTNLATSQAESRWASFIPFRKGVEADASKSYELTEENGPWLILAASFAGAGAAEQAHELVMELRSQFNLPAYINRKEFDYTETVEGKTIDRYTGDWAQMKYRNGSKFDAYAVLVGDYQSDRDPQLQKTLDKLKHARPECLDLQKREWSTQRFAGFRELQRRMNGDAEKRKKGPMGNAFVTRNPNLPEEYFAPGGLDDFVYELNRRVEHSLLENPGRYTVKVATFGGKETMNIAEIEDIERTGKVTNKLEIAADKAHRLTVALRAVGVEAYEFHDRTESMVTVGSFDSVGEPRADGKIEIHPAVHKIMQMYGADRREMAGGGSFGLQPRTFAGISFDVQAVPVIVPRRSIAAAYARSSSR
ncbi:MAG: hypothetical protein O3C40_07610 [Planctomycetota bacterium]|nr:hypothetical protein [Planctomycetota bacterium]